MWGKVVECADHLMVNRIIPTDVGKSLPRSRESDHPADHPHGCGEKA